MRAPFASVIVPTRDRPDTLLRALGSLLAQHESRWEALVVDDGEGDGAAAAIGLGDPRIQAFRAVGRGQVDTRNAALVRTEGELVCWLDDDDWWDDAHHLAAVRETAAAGPGLYYRGGWIVTDDGASGTREVFDHETTAASLRENNTILTSSIAYPRSAHRRLGLLDRELGGYCDWDFMLRLCADGLEPRKVPGLGVCYAIHADNLSTDYDAPARRAHFERFAAKHALQVRIANHVLIHRMLSE